MRQLRPSFLDDLSAAEARGRARCGASTPCRCGTAGGRTRVISHEMSRSYVLEYPVDDPDPDEDDDADEDEDDEDDEDGDDEEVETWQVSDLRRFP